LKPHSWQPQTTVLESDNLFSLDLQQQLFW
jgi:hypothetical protein